jgi:ribosomal protein S18 acetylase RimI-like enzyme
VAPLILRGAGTSCRVRPWSFSPEVAHLVFYSQSRVPSISDVASWMAELSRLGFRAVRTGALGLVGSSVVEDLGFDLLQTLTLLAHDDPGSAPRAAQPTVRVGGSRLERASDTDVAAFGPAWGIDAATIADMSTATPSHRIRGIAGDDAAIAAYAVSGRDGRLGFLQRLAVDPAVQHQGLGTALVADSLRWLARWRVSRVLVNTHVDNDAAIGLYHRMGFTTLPDQLRVFERSLP